MTKNILYTNEMFPVRLVFLIDILLTGISFILSYFLCSLILPDIWNHGMLIQLPIIVALTSFIFLFIGIYKGYVKYDKVREVYSIFNAICITNILTIILVVVNGKLFMEKELMVPLSIIVVHSILTFSALVVSRYLYKYLTVSRRKGLNKKGKSMFVFNETLGNTDAEMILSLLKKRNGENNVLIAKEGLDYLKIENNLRKTSSKVANFYLHGDIRQNDPEYLELLGNISKFKKPIYLVDLKSNDKASDKTELAVTRVALNDNSMNENQDKRDKEIFENSFSTRSNNTIEHQTI